MDRILIAATATALFGMCLCSKVEAVWIDYNVGVHYYPWHYNDFHGVWQRPFYDEPYIGGYDDGIDFDKIKENIEKMKKEEKSNGIKS